MRPAITYVRGVADSGLVPLTDQTKNVSVRSSVMYLLNEDLARAHMDARRAEAQRGALAARMARAQRLQRRAETAAHRARRAAARAL